MRIVKKWILAPGASGALTLLLLTNACGDGLTSGEFPSRGGAAGSVAAAGSATGGAAAGAGGGAGAAQTGGSISDSAAGGGNATGGSGAGGSSAGSAGSASAGTSAGGSGAGGSGAGVSGTGTDPFEILIKYRPTSGTAAGGYDDWMNEEIGTPVVTTGTAMDGNITAPILVPPGVTYDGMGQTIKPSIPGCDGSQTESQPPIFILAPGAILKNITISPPACDGVHMMGDNTIENITWTDVGEDAASVRSYFPGGAINIKGGKVNSAQDKVFQFNAPVQVTITDLVATNISKLVRQNGNSSFAMKVHLSNVKVSGCGEAVVRASSNCVFTHENVTADCPLWRDD